MVLALLNVTHGRDSRSEPVFDVCITAVLFHVDEFVLCIFYE